MRKIPTLFLRNPDDMRRLLPEVHPDCGWVPSGEGTATRKYDGTCVMIDDDGLWWARREVKAGKTAPSGYVEVEHESVTGKTVGWEPIERSPFVKAWRESLDGSNERRPAGTYELCGPKVNGNPEGYTRHILVRHADADELNGVPRDYDMLEFWLAEHTSIEGIVWHHPRMAGWQRSRGVILLIAPGGRAEPIGILYC